MPCKHQVGLLFRNPRLLFWVRWQWTATPFLFSNKIIWSVSDLFFIHHTFPWSTKPTFRHIINSVWVFFVLYCIRYGFRYFKSKVSTFYYTINIQLPVIVFWKFFYLADQNGLTCGCRIILGHYYCLYRRSILQPYWHFILLNRFSLFKRQYFDYSGSTHLYIGFDI
jgi:hypothetical protein